MENRPYAPDQSMMSAYALLETLNIDMNVDTFMELATFSMNRVRPINVSSKTAVVVADLGMIDLPVDMKYIRAVSADVNEFKNWKSEQEIESGDGVRMLDEFGNFAIDYSNSNQRVIGEYVDFERVDKSTLKVTTELVGETVFVLGSAPLLDEEGLPLLTLKQVEALAYQVALLYAQGMQFKGCKTGLDIAYITQMASRRTAQSRVPDYISDNQWNEIMDVRHSFDRKSYNKDFKFRK